MAFALTVCYIVLTILSPDQFGPLAARFHPALILAGIIFVFSLPELLGHRHLHASKQSFLLIAFTIAIALSQIANGWLGGAVSSWLAFLPAASVFFFIVANVTTARRLRILITAVVGSCFFVALEAMCAYYTGFNEKTFLLQHGVYFQDHLEMQFMQIRGVGFLNDPNDFAQMLIISLALMFIFWRRHRLAGNLVAVILPCAILLWAIYLTHSRGALMGLAILALMAIRRKLPTSVSIVLVVALVMIMLSLDFAAGRGISISDGEDRLEAWSNGLQMFKSAPLFGVGYGSFSENNNYLTAHNSLVLCLAELGLVGSTIWVALLVTTTLSLHSAMRRHKPQTKAGDQKQSAAAQKRKATSFAPTHWIVVMQLALISFMATSWFLSRTYSITMYLILGLATATIAIQRSAGKLTDRSPWILMTVTSEAAAILFIYGVVLLR